MTSDSDISTDKEPEQTTPWVTVTARRRKPRPRTSNENVAKQTFQNDSHELHRREIPAQRIQLPREPIPLYKQHSHINDYHHRRYRPRENRDFNSHRHQNFKSREAQHEYRHRNVTDVRDTRRPCYNCGLNNHLTNECHFDSPVTCRTCGKLGHKSRSCQQSKWQTKQYNDRYRY